MSQAEPTIQSVQRAAALLRNFAAADSELGVTALSRELGLHKSTVSRLLATLQQEGLVERNPATGKYYLGWGVITLAGAALERLNWPQVAHPHLVELTQRTGETSNITVLSGRECINIDGVPSPQPIQYVGRIGTRTPLHATSTGKVLLAHRPPEQRRDLLPDPLPQFTPHTFTNFTALKQELDAVQARGYATGNEELREGLTAVAAPIFDHNGQAIAAIAVSGPSYRITEQLEPLAEAVQQTARTISAQLGYRA